MRAILNRQIVVVNARTQNRKKTILAPMPPPGVGFYIREASRAYARALSVALVEHGVTLPQFFFLRVLWAGDGINQSELSSQIGVDRGTASFTLTSMEKQGMIERHTDADDLRKTKIYLTALGRRLRAPLLRVANKLNDNATLGMPDAEIERVKRALDRIVANLSGSG